jgi:tRNA dimethylallyltransferase
VNNQTSNRSIIVIAGPTASGKSSLAIKLAKEINGVIVNGDSRQVYKELSIGTAKPTKEEMQNIPHYLYGHVSVREEYNIYRYQRDFEKLVNQIPKEKNVILVGGSGLYIDSVIFKYSLQEEEYGEENKKRRSMLNKLSVKELQDLIKKINPEILERLNRSDRENPVRLVRVIEKGGFSNNKRESYKHAYFVIDIEKEKLESKIVKRTEEMFKQGLLEENKQIREAGLDKYGAFRTIGYQEFDSYFKREISLEEVKNEIIKNTKKYAKRQKTWFRKHKHAIWTDDYNLILEESLKVIRT